MSEYIVDFGDKSSAFVGLAMAEVRAHGAELHEPIIRCRDCAYMSDDGLTTAWCSENFREVRPRDFCAWGERSEE